MRIVCFWIVTSLFHSGFSQSRETQFSFPPLYPPVSIVESFDNIDKVDKIEKNDAYNQLFRLFGEKTNDNNIDKILKFKNMITQDDDLVDDLVDDGQGLLYIQ